MKTVPWQNFKKPLQGVPLGTWTSKFWVCRTSNWPNWSRGPKFQLSRSYGLGCRRGTNFCQRRRRRRRVTDGIFFIGFVHVLWLFIGKKHDLSNKIFSKFLVWNQYFLYIPYMMKVKRASVAQWLACWYCTTEGLGSSLGTGSIFLERPLERFSNRILSCT
jgi:hypothetical protein